jgi:tetratricopeptide (TPR) repeat protein
VKAADESQERADHLPDDPEWPDPIRREAGDELRVARHIQINLAVRQLDHNDAVGALNTLEELSHTYPDFAPLWLIYGKAWLRKKQPEAAEQALRRSAVLDPTAPETQLTMAVALAMQKRRAEAIPHLRRAIELKPDYASAYEILGECLQEEGDLPGAIDAFRTLLKCRPADEAARLRLAELLAAHGQREEARNQLRRVLELLPDDPRAKQLQRELAGQPVPYPSPSPK